MNPCHLCSDQQYLYQIYQLILQEKLVSNFQKRNKDRGKIAHSQWLTNANRILRLYVSTNEPSEILKRKKKGKEKLN